MVQHQGGHVDFARERRVRNGALMWMVAGIIVIKIATVWAISLLGAEGSGALPLAIAFVGLAIGTVGFVRFVGYDRRTRFIRPLRAPDFDNYVDGYSLPRPVSTHPVTTLRMGGEVGNSSRPCDFLNWN